MKALILAAGKGTRLKDLTRNVPKPMLPVDGRPLLDHLVRWLHSYGIRDLAMNLHHCPDVITDYFGDGSRHDVNITYSYELELLGTAGAAKRLQWFLDEPFLVIYGDLWTNVNLERFLRFHHHAAENEFSTGAPVLTLALYRVNNPTECGLVEIDGTYRVERFVEKPPADQVFTDLANAGIMVCQPEVLDYIPDASVWDFGRNVLPDLLAADAPIYGYPIGKAEFVIDIGTPAGLERMQSLVRMDASI